MSKPELRPLGLLLACLLLSASVLDARRRAGEQVTTGRNYTASEFPFMARIDIWNYDRGSIIRTCNAVILSKMYILTTNGCVHHNNVIWNQKTLIDPGRMYARYGCADYRHCARGTAYWEQVDKIWSRTGKDDCEMPLDLALLRCYRDIKFNENRDKIDIECDKSTTDCNRKDFKFSIAGIGNLSPKIEYENRLFPTVTENLDSSLINGSCTKEWSEEHLNQNQFCAGEVKHAGCTGDIGAPLFRKLFHGGFLLLGLMNDAVSESGGCESKGGNLFADVQANVKWIKGCMSSDTHPDCQATIRENKTMWPILRDWHSWK